MTPTEMKFQPGRDQHGRAVTTKPKAECHRDALVLVGPRQAMTATATAAAQALGSYIKLEAASLSKNSMVQHMLAQQPACCIVDGMPATPHAREMLKSLITAEQVQLRQPGTPAKLVKTPTFIIFTSDTDSVKDLNGDRRFFVVHAPIKQQKGGAKCA